MVVGPNGSGKSNVSDSILWATGSMSPGELRAEKPDDVLFAGSGGREAVDTCEVDLLFDNADGAWPELPFAEVSVARRLHRGGEGHYLVNRAPVRRLDLVELLSDVGLGGGLRSVISQGRVETVLNSKPVERRELVEEAAGLGRFKRRRHRAELKLARVAVQVDRARDLEDEVRKHLRPLALQATAAERAEKLGARDRPAPGRDRNARPGTARRATLGGRCPPCRGRRGAPHPRRPDRRPGGGARARRGRAHRCRGSPRGDHRRPLPARVEQRADRAPARGGVAARDEPGGRARCGTQPRSARLRGARRGSPCRRCGRPAGRGRARPRAARGRGAVGSGRRGRARAHRPSWPRSSMRSWPGAARRRGCSPAAAGTPCWPCAGRRSV